jgi:adenine-specific DNA-methyltransferase
VFNAGPKTSDRANGWERHSSGLLLEVDSQRKSLSPSLSADLSKRAALGQFFTPAPVAAFMASMIAERPDRQTLRLLDAGSGNGMLTAAAVAQICAAEDKPKEIVANAWEIDGRLTAELEQTFERCRRQCREHGICFTGDIRRTDFIRDATSAIGSTLFGQEALRFDLAILNPPYRKLRSDSPERQQLSSVGIETSNLYAVFLWLAIKLLDERGQLIAITPRSYMNGSYFKPFRRAILGEMRFDRVHVYETRDTAFGGDDVMQENAIISARKDGPVTSVMVTTSHGPEDEGHSCLALDPGQFVVPGDADQIMHIVSGENDAQIGERMRALPVLLHDLRIRASTGRIVEFRARERLRSSPTDGDAPMIFPQHFEDGYIVWPNGSARKPQSIISRTKDDPDLVPTGWYVVIKRFSAKEEKRRIVAALFDPGRVGGERIGFDNKLNILHQSGQGLPPALAKGLAVFLNSTIVDAYFRQFSGHTQVNAGDLRSLRFPDQETLERIGRRMNDRMPPQDEINKIVREEIPSMAQGNDPIAAKTKVEAAVCVLKELSAPKEQCNERSALTLLALLDLSPAADWSAAADPHRGVTETIDWIAANYGKRYAPNTRETIRRFTLHQFIQMGLVILNPGETRPPNSPKNIYQIEPSALRLLRTFATDTWTKNLAKYLKLIGGQNRLRGVDRQIAQIPVTLPGGQILRLSAGGQNVLIKEIVEQFAPRFTPGGHIVYVGDASEKHLLNDEPYFAELGVVVDRHGKMPDVVIHYLDKNWLVLV